MRLKLAIFSRYPRLFIAIALGIGVGFLIPENGRLVTHLLVGWNTTVWSYLGLMAILIKKTTPEQVKKVAEEEDGNGAVFTFTLTVAAMLSLAAIAFELAGAKDLSPALKYLHYAFTGATVFGSWLLIAVVYTIHYAHRFYQSSAGARSLKFPNSDEAPNYWDFLYFSLTISVAAQTSDISVMTTEMRKVVAVQSVLSFIFNAAIVGLSINIAAGLIGG